MNRPEKTLTLVLLISKLMIITEKKIIYIQKRSVWQLYTAYNADDDDRHL